MKGIGIAALAALLAATSAASGQPPDDSQAGQTAPADEAQGDRQGADGAASAGATTSISGEDMGTDGEGGQISTAIVEEATHSLSPVITRMASENLRATLYAMADEAQTHLSPGTPSSQLDADFRIFAACLAGNLSSMRQNRTYPEIISSDGLYSAAESQIQACSPFVQTRSNRMVALVAELLEHFLPRN